MKYIRTKDGIYESDKVSFDEKFVYKYEVRPIWLITQESQEILKQADTIEELCDLFVLYDNKRFVIAETDFDFVESVANNVNNSIKCPILHGCINTDKGLVYVAKMNEKGELELL